MKKDTPVQSGHQTEGAGPLVDIGFDVHKKTIFLAALCDRVWLIEGVFASSFLSQKA